MTTTTKRIQELEWKCDNDNENFTCEDYKEWYRLQMSLFQTIGDKGN